MMDNTYHICWTIDDFTARLREAATCRLISLDFETCPDPVFPKNEPNPLRAEFGARIAGIGIAWRRDGSDEKVWSCYTPIRHWRETAGGVQPAAASVLRALSDFIASLKPPQVLVITNVAMELSFMLAEGIVWPVRGVIQDVMIAARVLNKGVGPKEQIGLKPLAREYLRRTLESKDMMNEWLVKRRYKAGRDIWRVPVAFVAPYGQDDARDALELWMMWEDLVYQPPTEWWWSRPPDKTQRRDLFELEMEAAVCALMVGLRGTRVDVGFCARQAGAAEVLQDVCKRWIRSHLDMPTVNPGSQVQMRGILFSETFGLTVSSEHMTDTFKDLPEYEQSTIMSGRGSKGVVDYASLDIDALRFYEDQCDNNHKDLFFIMAVYRKCTTALTWFKENVAKYGAVLPDPWFDGAAAANWVAQLFHRLRTVGTVSGRMSSADYNSQQVVKRMKMLIDAVRLMRILADYLPPNQFDELMEMLVFSTARKGDEAKTVRVEPGARVVDFSVRRGFIPRQNKVWRSHDLSQVEMREFADLTGNQLLCGGYGTPLTYDQIQHEIACIKGVVDGADPLNALSPLGTTIRRHANEDLNDSPFDIHEFVASDLDIGRKSAKGVNFGIVYGMGKRKLARNLGWTEAQGAKYLAEYYGRFPEVKLIQDQIKEKIRTRGYVFDKFGRRYYLPMARSYVALNRLIQGWAASAFKIGFVRTCAVYCSNAYGGVAHPTMNRRTFGETSVLLCVHDEMDSEVPIELDDGLLDFCVRSSMTGIHGLRVPLGASSESSVQSWDGIEPTQLNFRGVA